MAERGLELSKEKTIITHIENGFDFLGCNVRWYKNKLLTKPSKKNYKSVIDKIRTRIKKYSSAKQEDLIRKLNPLIRGWVNYQKYNVSSEAFSHFDFDVWRSLWEWCKRRHPKKGKQWIVQKYFRRVGTRSWTFCATTKDGFDLKLIYATDTSITRYLKTKSEATPFNPIWNAYFEERDSLRMVRELKGRNKINFLYKTQKGIYPVCNEKLTIEKGFRIHNYQSSNYKEIQMLLHTDCHRKLHYSIRNYEPTLCD